MNLYHTLCLCVCLFLTKVLDNRWTDMVPFTVKFRDGIELILGYGTANLPYPLAPRKNITVLRFIFKSEAFL